MVYMPHMYINTCELTVELIDLTSLVQCKKIKKTMYACLLCIFSF